MSQFESTVTQIRTPVVPSKHKEYRCNICSAVNVHRQNAVRHYVERHLCERRDEYVDYTLCLFKTANDVIEYCDHFGYETYPGWGPGWYVHLTSEDTLCPFAEFLEIKEEEMAALRGFLKQLEDTVNGVERGIKGG